MKASGPPHVLRLVEVKASGPPHVLRLVEMKASGPPHVLKLWFGVCKGMLPVEYFLSDIFLFCVSHAVAKTATHCFENSTRFKTAVSVC